MIPTATRENQPKVDTCLCANALRHHMAVAKRRKERKGILYLEKSLFPNKPNSRFAEAYQKLAEILYPDVNFSFKSEK